MKRNKHIESLFPRPENITALVRDAAHRVTLSSEEKKEIKDQILAFMEKAPGTKTPEPGDENKKPVLFLFRQYRLAAAITTFVFMLGSTVAFAAKNSLPGDALYAVKGFNEKAGLFFSLSDEARVKKEARLAAARLREAAVLASEGRLDEEKMNAIDAGFSLRAASVAEGLERLRARNKVDTAAKISAEFDILIYAHSLVMSRLSRSDDFRKTDIEISEAAKDDERQPAAGAIDPSGANNEVKVQILDFKVKHEVQGESEGSSAALSAKTERENKMKSEKQLEAVGARINELKLFLQDNKSHLSPGAYAEAEVRINKGEAMLSEARENIGTRAYIEAEGTLMNVEALIVGTHVFIEEAGREAGENAARNERVIFDASQASAGAVSASAPGGGISLPVSPAPVPATNPVSLP